MPLPNIIMKNSFESYQMEGPDLGDLPGKYVSPIEIKIFYREFEKHEEGEELCGCLKMCFANVQQIQKDGLDCDEVLESHIGDDFREIRRLYNHEQGNWTCNLTKNAYEALNYTDEDKAPGNENFVYIQTLKIIAKHRGNRVGIGSLEKALKYVVKRLNLRFFVMIPYPLQDIKIIDGRVLNPTECDEQMEYDKLEKDKDKAHEQLCELYGEIGFNLVKDTNLMVCRADNFYETVAR